MEIKRVMIDPGKLIDVLYWDVFDILRLDLDELRPFRGSLVGFSGEYVQLNCYITPMMLFEVKQNAKTIN